MHADNSMHKGLYIYAHERAHTRIHTVQITGNIKEEIGTIESETEGFIDL